jgi:hypothetical protein
MKKKKNPGEKNAISLLNEPTNFDRKLLEK